MRTQFKKFGLDSKFDMDSFFSTTFEAVLHIFRKDFPDSEILREENSNQRDEESDPEDAVDHPGRYKAYKIEEQYFATQI